MIIRRQSNSGTDIGAHFDAGLGHTAGAIDQEGKNAGKSRFGRDAVTRAPASRPGDAGAAFSF